MLLFRLIHIEVYGSSVMETLDSINMTSSLKMKMGILGICLDGGDEMFCFVLF